MKPMPSFEELQQPLPTFSPKNVYYILLRFLLRTIGNLSDGIRIGNMYGYDSGVMIDYVYKNRPSGRFGVGTLIDWAYLNSVGWRGIRLRKLLLVRYLTRVVQDHLQRKPHIRYLDIACGGAEYDIEALKQFDASKIDVELRDYKMENIEKATHNASAHGLRSIRFQQANAFDAANYGDRWDVVVASGFWEIIDDDSLIKGCIQNIAACLNSGGSLVFTIQPYHPQLEMAARALTSNTGKPWIMRLRSLDLYRQWLNEAGLEYASHEMETHQIFGVVEARRKGSTNYSG
jgi:2-polyprenyl-3-methyl-5-hydroxy-6-metoxy-1,4-benzoquinol methylase